MNAAQTLTATLGQGVSAQDSPALLKSIGSAVESMGSAVDSISVMSGVITNMEALQKHSGPVLAELQATITSSAKLNQQFSDQMTVGDQKANAMAAIQEKLMKSLKRQLRDMSKISEGMSLTIAKQGDDLITNKISLVQSGFQDMLKDHSTAQTLQNKDLQIQMGRFHSNFVNQQRCFELDRYDNSSRKRYRDSKFPSPPPNHRRMNCYDAPGDQPEGKWYDLGNHNERVRQPPAAKDWQEWSSEDIRVWVVGIGCPLLAAALFPPAGSNVEPPFSVANGKMLRHVYKFVDTLGGKGQAVAFERVHLKGELQSLIPDMPIE